MKDVERWMGEHLAGRAVTVVGVGNRLRGDDGAGPALVDRLGRRWREHPPEGGVTAAGEGRLQAGRWRALDAGTVPENFLDELLAAAPDVVLFVDAADHDGAPGAWVLAPPGTLTFGGASTHTTSLCLLAGLLASYGIECWLLGVQPGPSRLGEGLTRAVAAGVETMARALAAQALEVAHA